MIPALKKALTITAGFVFVTFVAQGNTMAPDFAAKRNGLNLSSRSQPQIATDLFIANSFGWTNLDGSTFIPLSGGRGGSMLQPVISTMGVGAQPTESIVSDPQSPHHHPLPPIPADPAGVPDNGSTAALLGLAFLGVAVLRRKLKAC